MLIFMEASPPNSPPNSSPTLSERRENQLVALFMSVLVVSALLIMGLR